MSDIEDDDAISEQDAMIEARLAEAVRLLMSCCDTVQIFVTVHQPSGEEAQTVSLCKGAGNHYARYGQVRDWIIGSDHRTRLLAGSLLADDEDDDAGDE